MDHRIDAIYGRQSIDKKNSISIESQFEFCRYELKGGEGKEYKDKGYSGKNIDRPDFQRLLGDIKAGLIKRVVVYKLDRISRSIVDFAKLMEIFKQNNVEFVSCTEKFDTSTPMGRAMLNICIVFAQLERESIQMRVTDAFYSRCAKLKEYSVLAWMQTEHKKDQARKLFINGGLYEESIQVNGITIDVAAEVEINGNFLVLRDICIYARQGDMPNSVGMVFFKTMLKRIVAQARLAGYSTLRIVGQRALHSTSANPGMLIDRIINLK